MTQKIYPRSPYQRLGGYVHLPRLIDKARLHRCGLLHGYKYKTSGFDQHLLSFLGIDGDEFERMASELSTDEAMLAWIRAKANVHTPAEIEAWNAAMVNREPETPDRISLCKRLLAQAGGAGGSAGRLSVCAQARSLRVFRIVDGDHAAHLGNSVARGEWVPHDGV